MDLHALDQHRGATNVGQMVAFWRTRTGSKSSARSAKPSTCATRLVASSAPETPCVPLTVGSCRISTSKWGRTLTELLSSTLSTIHRRVDELRRDFNSCPSKYVCGESDLSDELFALLRSDFSALEEIKNIYVWDGKPMPRGLHFLTRRLHSEVRLAGSSIDLAVLDLTHVTVSIDPKGRFSHFQLVEDGEKGEHVFIEVKASRTNRGQLGRKRWRSLIEKDIAKSNRISEGHCLVICFEFDDLLGDAAIAALHERARPNVKLLYCKNPRK